MNKIGSGFEPLLDVKSTAEALSLHPKTLMRMAREHRIPAFRVGRYWLFRASLIDAWLKEQLERGQANFAA
jgi:excisionase family DNA binding protein